MNYSENQKGEIRWAYLKSYTFYVSLTFMDTFLRENLNFRSISTEIDNQKRLVSTADKEVTPPPRGNNLLSDHLIAR